MPALNPQTAAQQLLRLSKHLGIDYIFVNLGSDHPAFIEAFARFHADGVDMPRVISCPHEMTALSAAHGYAMITRRPQMVLVHVDVGTQNLGGSVHNASRGRVPAIIVAGLSPVTTSGERVGARNEFIHYIQDTPRQPEIVGQYMKWCYELRAAEMVDGVLQRGVQMATTMPEGPVYISGAREIWDAAAPPSPELPADWPAAGLAGLTVAAAGEIYRAICAARRPIVITTYLGRQPKTVARLVELSERLGLGVCEVSPQYLNFPGDHPHHLSYRRNALVDEADLILMIDVDVPWIVAKTAPPKDAALFHIDLDPLKTGMGFWHFPAQASYLADSQQALEDLLAVAGACDAPAPGRAERCAWIAATRQRLSAPPPQGSGGEISAEELTEAVRELVNEHTVIVFEEPSSTELVPPILRLNRPGSFFHSGGIGLGWGINAAIGAKLADPDAEVIALVGDGCFLFGVPSSAYWVAGTYATPHLTIIYNNGGWNSPKLSTLGVHPDGYAKRNDRYWVTVGSGARLAGIAEATGGAVAFEVKDRHDLRETLHQALQTVRQGRCAVVDVAIAPISKQVL
ncbi:MAG: thiamine pyrophosphate-requiring protein [Sterolibacterium sp.]|jgi:acetolactate synthase-1/2/3 large subunit